MKKINFNKNNQFYLFLIITICAIFFRYYNYNLQDFWWDELMEFSTTNPELTFKETFLRAHSLTPGTKLSYDYATNANFYFYIYKFFLEFSYTPGTARLITASVGLLVFFISIIIFKKFIGKNYIPLSLLLASNYYLIIQSQEYKYNIFFCFMCLLSIYSFFLWIEKNNTKKEKTLKIFSFIFLLLTVWTHMFGFLLYLTQLIVLFFKKRDLFFKNIQYFIFLPMTYSLINFQQLKNFFSIKEFPVPQKSFEFFFDYDFKYFFGSIISGKIFLVVFIFLIIYSIKKLKNMKFEIIFLYILLFLTYFLPLTYSLISKPIFQTRYVIYIIPVILFLIVFLTDFLKSNLIRNSILVFLILISFSNTFYSLYILKKNDKPHVTKILSEIKNYSDNEIIIATSNEYFLNFLKNKKKFSKLGISFVSCEKTNLLDVKLYWELTVWHSDRFMDCHKQLKQLGIDSKERKVIDTLKERYTSAKLVTFID